jgi:hypothetical protein
MEVDTRGPLGEQQNVPRLTPTATPVPARAKPMLEATVIHIVPSVATTPIKTAKGFVLTQGVALN